MRWILLETVTSIEPGKSAKALASIPEAPVSPELILMEMMAQTGGVLVGAESDFMQDLVFTKIDTADFPGPFPGGEKIEISAASGESRPEGGWVDAEIVNSRGSQIARARFLLMAAGPLVPSARGSVTFHEAFMKHFKIREKVRA